MRYIKKPPAFDAMQWDGTIDGAKTVAEWIGGVAVPGITLAGDEPVLVIGDKRVWPGYFVLKNASGQVEHVVPEEFLEREFLPVYGDAI